MPAHVRTRILIVGFALIMLLPGCASPEIVNSVSRQGKFRTFNCAQLDTRGAELLKRERELNGLMEKARKGPGGEIAIAVAYQNEYNTALGDLREVEMTGSEKSCVLKYRTASERAVQ